MEFVIALILLVNTIALFHLVKSIDLLGNEIEMLSDMIYDLWWKKRKCIFMSASPSASPSPAPNDCIYCGAYVPDESPYCPNCGAKVS